MKVGVTTCLEHGARRGKNWLGDDVGDGVAEVGVD